MQDDIDRVLANEVEITPSSGFLSSVMEAVEREAIAPPPVEFPLFRVLPGFLAAMVALAVAIWNGIGSLNDPATIAAFDEQLHQLTVLATGYGFNGSRLPSRLRSFQ